MAAPTPPARTPDEILNGPVAEGDGEGIGNTLGPDVSVEAERREIERGVYQRRGGAEPEAPEEEAGGPDPGRKPS